MMVSISNPIQTLTMLINKRIVQNGFHKTFQSGMLFCNFIIHYRYDIIHHLIVIFVGKPWLIFLNSLQKRELTKATENKLFSIKFATQR